MSNLFFRVGRVCDRMRLPHQGRHSHFKFPDQDDNNGGIHHETRCFHPARSRIAAVPV